MDVKLRWSLRIIAVLAAGLLIQILLARSIALLGAEQGARAWLENSLGRSVEAIHAQHVQELGSGTELLTATRLFQDALARRDPAALDVAVATYLRRDDLSWTAWSSTSGVSLGGGPAAEQCFADRLAALPDGNGVLHCGGRARLAVIVALDQDTWADRFSVAMPLDAAYTQLLADVSWAEVMLMDGPVVVSTLRDPEGHSIAPGLPREMLDAVQGEPSHFATYKLMVPDYRGFRSSRGRWTTRSWSRWTVASRRLSEHDPVYLVLMAPANLLNNGVHSATLILVLGSLLLLVLFGALLDRTLARFIHPVASLVRSARAVAAGDLRTRVPVPDDGEMRELCLTYNDMVEQLSDQMSLQRTASREAGRAEVAMDVLHNVGNVLTSVVVSASDVAERIERLTPGRIQRLVTLLREDPELSRSMQASVRGDTVIAYLEAVARHRAEEREVIRVQLDTLLDHVDHMKVVVGAHQKFARSHGVVEHCIVRNLVDDALVIAGVRWAHHGIDVRTELSGGREVHVDRHRVLQVLTNLLRNARDALVSGGADEPRIRLVVDARPGRLMIAVRDNGQGIATQDLARVFTHGFTTKPTGNGFGLHACALAAHDMGGTLSCHSEGHGLGAVFTLDVPTHPPGTPIGAPSRVITQ